MTNPNFETLLGKDILKTLFMGISENKLDDNVYIISNPKIQYFGKPIDQILITTDDYKITQRIFFTLEEPIDTTFYKIMSNNYGSDYDVMVMEGNFSEESSVNTEGSFKETLKQRTWLLKKGHIEDSNINHVLWNKDDFRVMLFYNSNKNRMDVHFIKK